MGGVTKAQQELSEAAGMYGVGQKDDGPYLCLVTCCEDAYGRRDQVCPVLAPRTTDVDPETSPDGPQKDVYAWKDLGSCPLVSSGLPGPLFSS